MTILGIIIGLVFGLWIGGAYARYSVSERLKRLVDENKKYADQIAEIAYGKKGEAERDKFEKVFKSVFKAYFK